MTPGSPTPPPHTPWSATAWAQRGWMLLLVSSAIYFLADNEADNDLWVHLFIGRRILASLAIPRLDDLSYTASGAPWVDHEWLIEVLFAALYGTLGTAGLWLFKLAVGLAAAWLLWSQVARHSQSAWVRGAVTVIALATLARGFAVRPQIVTYAGLAALLAWLDAAGSQIGTRRSMRGLVAATAVGFVIWANMHAGFVVGLLVLGLFAAAPPWRGALRRWALAVTGLLAACVNPYGPRLFEYIWGEIGAPHPLTEWQPVQIGDPAHVPFLIMFAALLLTLPFARILRGRLWWAALIAITALMAFQHQRHIPLFALCAAAPLADQLDGLASWWHGRTAFRLSPPATAALAAALFALALTQLGLLTHRLWREGPRIVYEAADYPVGAVNFLRRNGIGGNLASPLDWGGYVLWHAAPAIKISLDGRFATAYRPAVVEENFAFFRGQRQPGAARLLDEHATTLALIPRGRWTPVENRPAWRRLYTDQVATLFARGDLRKEVRAEAHQGRIPFP